MAGVKTVRTYSAVQKHTIPYSHVSSVRGDYTATIGSMCIIKSSPCKFHVSSSQSMIEDAGLIQVPV